MIQDVIHRVILAAITERLAYRMQIWELHPRARSSMSRTVHMLKIGARSERAVHHTLHCCTRTVLCSGPDRVPYEKSAGTSLSGTLRDTGQARAIRLPLTSECEFAVHECLPVVMPLYFSSEARLFELVLRLRSSFLPILSWSRPAFYSSLYSVIHAHQRRIFYCET